MAPISMRYVMRCRLVKCSSVGRGLTFFELTHGIRLRFELSSFAGYDPTKSVRESFEKFRSRCNDMDRRRERIRRIHANKGELSAELFGRPESANKARAHLFFSNAEPLPEKTYALGLSRAKAGPAEAL